MNASPAIAKDQPLLFEDLPIEPALIAFVAQKEFKHTGSTLSKDQPRFFGIVGDLISGMSQRAVAQKWETSRQGLRRLVDLLEEQGELEPLKKRLMKKGGHLLELSIETMTELTEQGLMPPASVGFQFGIVFDKMALLAGEATSRTEEIHRHVVRLEDYQSWVKDVERQAVDVQSTVLPENTK